MAQTNCPTTLQAVAIRATRLTSAGAIVAGAGGMIESQAFITFGSTPEVEEGEDFSQKNASGGYCQTYKDPDRIKWMNHELTICGPDPEFHELLLGGDVILDSGDVNSIGWAMPAQDDAEADPVSIELWTKAIVGGVQDATLPYYHHVFPMTKNWKLGGRTFSNGVQEITFTGGRGYENASWGNGPRNNWNEISDRMYQYLQVAAADLPTTVCGIQAIPAQS